MLGDSVSRTCSDMLTVVINKPFVHFVADVQCVMLFTKICDELDLFLVEHLKTNHVRILSLLRKTM